MGNVLKHLSKILSDAAKPLSPKEIANQLEAKTGNIYSFKNVIDALSRIFSDLKCDMDGDKTADISGFQIVETPHKNPSKRYYYLLDRESELDFSDILFDDLNENKIIGWKMLPDGSIEVPCDKLLCGFDDDNKEMEMGISFKSPILNKFFGKNIKNIVTLRYYGNPNRCYIDAVPGSGTVLEIPKGTLLFYDLHSIPLDDIRYYTLRISKNNHGLFTVFLESNKMVGIDYIGDNIMKKTQYWIYSPGENAYKWDEFYISKKMAIGWGEIGDLTQYHSRDEIKQAMKDAGDSSNPYKLPSLAAWQFLSEMKPGDIVFAKRGRNKIIGRGVVMGSYYYDENVKDDYKNIRAVNWINDGSWEISGLAPMKTLTNITRYTEYVEELSNLFEKEETKEIANDIKSNRYTSNDFLKEVFLPNDDDYDDLKNILKLKKNLILYGPPGVGKTFAAKRLAYSIIGEKNDEYVMTVQFHQTYSYEDFVQGFRPTRRGIVLKNGPFYDFCNKAGESDKPFFFIIDEINRGNVSKIFGELLMLIEGDKRGKEHEIKLLYSDKKFSVPNNLHIIGMMNTADRSLARMDYALRRRFSFYEMCPAFDSKGFQGLIKNYNNPKFNALVNAIKSVNMDISNDASLGKDCLIGHSYLCNPPDDGVSDRWLREVINYDIIPLIKEYWFENQDKVDACIKKFNEVFII